MLVIVSKVVGWADYCNLQTVHHFGLADASVKHWALSLRVGTDEDNQVGLVDASDARVHQVLGTEVSVKLGRVAAGVDVLAVEAVKEILEGNDAFEVLELTDHSLNLVARNTRKLFGSQLHSLLPLELCKSTIIAAGHRNRKSLLLESIKGVARFVADPFFIYVFVDPREDAQ